MIAHFSSKLNQRVSAALVALLLVFCVLGTHWVGLVHHVSHLSLAKQTSCPSLDKACKSSAGHSSEACHLFDALSLAGCIPPSHALALLLNTSNPANVGSYTVRAAVDRLIPYRSQAPPSLIL